MSHHFSVDLFDKTLSFVRGFAAFTKRYTVNDPRLQTELFELWFDNSVWLAVALRDCELLIELLTRIQA